MSETDLGTYDGLPVFSTGGMVVKLNQRLSDTLGVQPRIISVDETVFAIVRLGKVKDRYDYIRDDANHVIGAERVQVFEARNAVLFDESDKDALLGDVLQRAVDLFIEAEAMKRDGQLTMNLNIIEDEGSGDVEG